jgi:hypothetical protein
MALVALTQAENSYVTTAVRYRLPDSAVCVSELQTVLRAWWEAAGTRNTSELLKNISRAWFHRGCPCATDLVGEPVFLLASELVHIDPTLHPRHSRLVCALIAEHGKKACMGTSRRPEFEAMELSRFLLKAFGKYRDLVRDPLKLKSVYRTATADEKGKIDNFVVKIVLPNSHKDMYATSTRTHEGDTSRRMASTRSDAFDLDIDDLAAELGQSMERWY